MGLWTQYSNTKLQSSQIIIMMMLVIIITTTTTTIIIIDICKIFDPFSVVLTLYRTITMFACYYIKIKKLLDLHQQHRYPCPLDQSLSKLQWFFRLKVETNKPMIRKPSNYLLNVCPIQSACSPKINSAKS